MTRQLDKYKRTRIKCACTHCEKEFTLNPTEYRRRLKKNQTPNMFCSLKCYHAWAKEKKTHLSPQLQRHKIRIKILKARLEIKKKEEEIAILEEQYNAIKFPQEVPHARGLA